MSSTWKTGILSLRAFASVPSEIPQASISSPFLAGFRSRPIFANFSKAILMGFPKLFDRGLVCLQTELSSSIASPDFGPFLFRLEASPAAQVSRSGGTTARRRRDRKFVKPGPKFAFRTLLFSEVGQPAKSYGSREVLTVGSPCEIY